jgi:hypothetical protein
LHHDPGKHGDRAGFRGFTVRHLLAVLAVVAAAMAITVTKMPQGVLGLAVQTLAGTEHAPAANAGPGPFLAPPQPPRGSANGALAALNASTLSSIASDCSVDVSAPLDAYLASLPDGGVLSSPAGACYLVNEGIRITHPLTLAGGTFTDDSSTVPARKPDHSPSPLYPIIDILDTHNVTVENVHVLGANVDGSYHRHLVNNAGIDVLSSDQVTLTNIVSTDTFGDGLELWTNWPTSGRPDTSVHVNGYTVIRAGRYGFTPAYVKYSTFNNVHVASAADAAWDFESDTAGTGSGYITITNCSVYTHTETAFNIIEGLSGPVSFSNCTGSGHINFKPGGPSAPVTISNSTIDLPRTDPGTPPAGIFDQGGTLTLNNDTFNRLAGTSPLTGPAWRAVGHATLIINQSTVAKPLGTNAATSTVTVNP